MDRNVLVTGASKGIGRATAARLAARGFRIVVHYNHDQEGAVQTLSEIESAGGKGDLLQLDISDRSQCREALEHWVGERGAFYGVVLNAGISDDSAFPAMDADAWDKVLDTNLGGFYNVLHPLVMPMVRLRQGGRIVVLSSISGVMGNRGQVNYSATKAGLIGAAKSLAVELGKRQITVNCVAPGLIETDMIANLPLDDIVKTIPLQRLGQVDEVAATIDFLFSDQAGYITRQVISINGGMI